MFLHLKTKTALTEFKDENIYPLIWLFAPFILIWVFCYEFIYRKWE